MKKITDKKVNEELFGRTKAAKAAWDAFSKAPGSKLGAAKTAYQQRRAYSQVADMLPSVIKQWNQVAGLNPAGNNPATLKSFVAKKAQEIAGQDIKIPEPRTSNVTAAMDPTAVKNYMSKVIGLSLQAKALNPPAAAGGSDDSGTVQAAATQTAPQAAATQTAPQAAATPPAAAPTATPATNVFLKSGYKDLTRMYQELVNNNQRPSKRTKDLLNKVAMMESKFKEIEYQLFQESVNRIGKNNVKNK